MTLYDHHRAPLRRWSAAERIDMERDEPREGFLVPLLVLLFAWIAVYLAVLFLGAMTEPLPV